MSRFEYSDVSLTWALLTECAVHLVDFSMYQTKTRSKGTWGLVNGRYVSDFISSAYFPPYHCLVQTQPSVVMAYPTLQSYFLLHTVQRLVQYINIQWCVSQTQQNFYYGYYCSPSTIINIIKVLLCLTDTSLYICICVKHLGMANIKKEMFVHCSVRVGVWRLCIEWLLHLSESRGIGVVVCLARVKLDLIARSYSGTCDDKTIVIMVAGQRGLDANVASDSKWVLDIHLMGPVQSR